MKRLSALLLISFAFIGYSLAQCPMCKTAVESNLKNDGAQVGLGLNDGILYLLGAPYLLISIVVFFWYRNYRLKKNQAA
jgi:hypothetical protein